MSSNGYVVSADEVTRRYGEGEAAVDALRGVSLDDCRKKLRELEEIGVDQFNIYLMTHDQEETLQVYGDGIIPQFSGVAA